MSPLATFQWKFQTAAKLSVTQILAGHEIKTARSSNMIYGGTTAMHELRTTQSDCGGSRFAPVDLSSTRNTVNADESTKRVLEHTRNNVKHDTRAIREKHTNIELNNYTQPKATAVRNLPLRVLQSSSSHTKYPASNLHQQTADTCSKSDGHTSADDAVVNRHRRWESEKYCTYPQHLVLSLPGLCQVHRLEIIVHPFKVPCSISVYAVDTSADPITEHAPIDETGGGDYHSEVDNGKSNTRYVWLHTFSSLDSGNVPNQPLVVSIPFVSADRHSSTLIYARALRFEFGCSQPLAITQRYLNRFHQISILRITCIGVEMHVWKPPTKNAVDNEQEPMHVTTGAFKLRRSETFTTTLSSADSTVGAQGQPAECFCNAFQAIIQEEHHCVKKHQFLKAQACKDAQDLMLKTSLSVAEMEACMRKSAGQRQYVRAHEEYAKINNLKLRVWQRLKQFGLERFIPDRERRFTQPLAEDIQLNDSERDDPSTTTAKLLLSAAAAARRKEHSTEKMFSANAQSAGEADNNAVMDLAQVVRRKLIKVAKALFSRQQPTLFKGLHHEQITAHFHTKWLARQKAVRSLLSDIGLLAHRLLKNNNQKQPLHSRSSFISDINDKHDTDTTQSRYNNSITTICVHNWRTQPADELLDLVESWLLLLGYHCTDGVPSVMLDGLYAMLTYIKMLVPVLNHNTDMLRRSSNELIDAPETTSSLAAAWYGVRTHIRNCLAMILQDILIHRAPSTCYAQHVIDTIHYFVVELLAQVPHFDELWQIVYSVVFQPLVRNCRRACALCRVDIAYDLQRQRKIVRKAAQVDELQHQQPPTTCMGATHLYVPTTFGLDDELITVFWTSKAHHQDSAVRAYEPELTALKRQQLYKAFNSKFCSFTAASSNTEESSASESDTKYVEHSSARHTSSSSVTSSFDITAVDPCDSEEAESLPSTHEVINTHLVGERPSTESEEQEKMSSETHLIEAEKNYSRPRKSCSKCNSAAATPSTTSTASSTTSFAAHTPPPPPSLSLPVNVSSSDNLLLCDDNDTKPFIGFTIIDHSKLPTEQQLVHEKPRQEKPLETTKTSTAIVHIYPPIDTAGKYGNKLHYAASLIPVQIYHTVMRSPSLSKSAQPATLQQAQDNSQLVPVTSERIILSECYFCAEHDRLFAADARHYNYHLYKLCPMLLPCEKCDQIVPVAHYSEHQLKLCPKRADWRKCEKCQMVFSSRSKLKAHQQQKANKSNRSLTCRGEEILWISSPAAKTTTEEAFFQQEQMVVSIGELAKRKRAFWCPLCDELVYSKQIDRADVIGPWMAHVLGRADGSQQQARTTGEINNNSANVSACKKNTRRRKVLKTKWKSPDKPSAFSLKCRGMKKDNRAILDDDEKHEIQVLTNDCDAPCYLKVLRERHKEEIAEEIENGIP